MNEPEPSTSALWAALPARQGHFLLESGYHTDVWLTLDAMFVDLARIEPLVHRLADRIRRHDVTAVCGPMVGGAFLAQALAQRLGVRFYYAEPVANTQPSGLFTAQYRLPAGQRPMIRGERLAVVDEVVSAGSSLRAAVADAEAAGAAVTVVGALVFLGREGLDHFAARGIPAETLERRAFELWRPDDCPLCRKAVPLQRPLASAQG